MKFSQIDVVGAEGAILAHSVKLAGSILKKGHCLTAADIAALEGNGIAKIFAARLEPEDVGENEAASAVARAISGSGVLVHEAATGRANIHALKPGIALIDGERLKELNRLHESLTLATVAPFSMLAHQQMIATVKIIPFSVPRAVLNRALEIAAGGPLIDERPFSPHRTGLVLTKLPQTKQSLIDKSREGVLTRLEALGSNLGSVLVVTHTIEAVSQSITELLASGHDLVLVFGASAIVDRGDVIPAALVAAGGEVVHLGMPVDPGNLLMYGRLGRVPVIGVPSCARSPKVNGFDWVLQRTLAGMPLSAVDIMDMGGGGLLMEIPTRPLPRETQPPKVAKSANHIAALVLAAGKSTRMGSNKLLKNVHGKPMIRHTVENVLQSRASPVFVVTGHEEAGIRSALEGLAVTFVQNPKYAEGLSTSLKAGLAQLPPTVDGVLVMLGDMPLVPVAAMNKLISAFNPSEGRSICVPVFEGDRGNPILWGRQHFSEFDGIKGDGGAKVLLVVNSDNVAEVPVRNEGVLADFDTPDSLNALK